MNPSRVPVPASEKRLVRSGWRSLVDPSFLIASPSIFLAQDLLQLKPASSLRQAQEPLMSGHSNAQPAIAIAGADPRLYNHDLAPVAPAGRTWGVFSIFAMWMSDVHSVGGYTFAASLFFLGLTGWEVLLAMVVGITAVYFLMNLIGRPSLKYGTPFPVVARMSFGVMGANIAAALRGIVGIVWYGVPTYFASKAVQALVLAFYPGAEALTHSSLLGLCALGWVSLLFMCLFQH